MKSINEFLQSPEEADRIQGLATLIKEPTPENLVRVLTIAEADPSVEVRFYARRVGSVMKKALGDVPPRKLPGAIPAGEAAGLLNGSEEERLKAIRSATVHYQRPLLPQLRERLRLEENPVVLSSLVLAIGNLGEGSDIDLLVPFLDHATPRVRANTVEAIDFAGIHQALPHILRKLQDPDNRVRANAARVVKAVAPSVVGQVVTGMIRSNLVSMKASGAYMLRFFPTGSGFRLLEPLLASSDSCVRNNALASLKVMAQKDLPPAKALLEKIGKTVDAAAETTVTLGKELAEVCRSSSEGRTAPAEEPAEMPAEAEPQACAEPVPAPVSPPVAAPVPTSVPAPEAMTETPPTTAAASETVPETNPPTAFPTVSEAASKVAPLATFETMPRASVEPAPAIEPTHEEGPEAIPEAAPATVPEAGPATAPEASSEASSEATSELAPAPGSETVSETVSEPVPAAAPSFVPMPASEALSEDAPMPGHEDEPAPVPATEPEPEPEPAPEPASEAAPEPAPEPASVAAPEPEPAPEPASEAVPEPAPAPEPAPEPEPEKSLATSSAPTRENGLLAALLAALREPLSLEALLDLLRAGQLVAGDRTVAPTCEDWNQERLTQAMAELGDTIQVTTLPDGKSGFALPHGAPPELVAAGHELLGTLTLNPDAWQTHSQPYLLRWGPHHLLAAERRDDLHSLLTSLRYCEAKADAGLLAGLIADLKMALEVLPPDRQGLPRVLKRALRADLSFVMRRPSTLFQSLWNRCWWYDCPIAAEFYMTPKGGSKTTPPWNEPGGKAHRLMESWKEAKSSVTNPIPASLPPMAAIPPRDLWLRAVRPPKVNLGASQIAVFQEHQSGVNGVAFSPDGARIASVSEDLLVRVRETADGPASLSLKGHLDRVNAVAFSPDGRFLVTGSHDQTVRVWDLIEESEILCLEGHEGPVTGVGFSPDGSRIVSGSDDQTVRIWLKADGSLERCLRGHTDGVFCVAVSPDGTRIASGANDQTIRLWDAANGEEQICLRGHANPVTSVAFSPDGMRIVSGSWDPTIRVWDVSNCMQLARLEGHEWPVYGVAFSPDGERVVSGSFDNTVRVWDAGSGKERMCLRGHASRITSVAFSPDGAFICSGSNDRTIRLWEAAGGRETIPLRDHEFEPVELAFSSDGTCLIGKATDGKVRLWDVVSGKSLEWIQGRDPLPTLAAPTVTVTTGRITFRALAYGPEIVVERQFQNTDWEPVAWFPGFQKKILAHPTAPVFALWDSRHLQIIRLESFSPPAG